MNFLGRPVRRTFAKSPVLHLTFDDGPDEISTPQVLDLLNDLQVKATFFTVAEKAIAHPEIIKRILANGHTIGNHSLDHKYKAFFGGLKAMKSWISRSEEKLSSITGTKTVGFRPPAGIRTPELARALAELNIPLVLWNCRFYDTVFKWTESKAKKSLIGTQSGSIILLHDRQSPQKLPLFLKTLRAYITSARQTGFEFAPLTRESCSRTNER